MATIHEEVRDLLAEVQSEAGDFEKIAGHDLMRIRDGLSGALASIRASRVAQDYREPETEAGYGAVATGEGERHPEAVASEPRPESAEELERRADREPDPNVREKVRLGAQQAYAAAEQAGTASPPPPGPPEQPSGQPEEAPTSAPAE